MMLRTWISELEMIHFMLSMYLSSWWWVHGCMDELQCITTGVMRLVVCDIFIPHLSLRGGGAGIRGGGARLEHTIVKES